jgi:hypothetical protein
MQTNEAEILMPDIDSTGQLEMRALSSRLRDYVAEMHGEPEKAFDLNMAAELMTHLASQSDHEAIAACRGAAGLGKAAVARRRVSRSFQVVEPCLAHNLWWR